MSRHSKATLLVLVLGLLPASGWASPPTPGDSSIRARLKACILMGDLECVVTQYLLLKDIGRVPGWLVAFQNAFTSINREAGKCESVAKTIHEGLTRLVLLKTHQLSPTGYHVAIRLGDKVIDAYTGFAGLPIPQYMARLSASPGSKIVEEVVQTL
jgi:hypothetical protein